ncbi:methyltransferase domain-containing protein [Candidatus Woesearchaeota archaeon]|nr:methyltransferase domain-containing protein [Candidatus Woesearchaeota archaeon]
MSSSVPCNIPYMLSLISKNILTKVDLSKINVKDVFSGKPIPMPEFNVLDIGCGFGKWGFLIRDTFDIMIGQTFSKSEWKINITGVEPFEKCIGEIQKETYNKIIRKNIFEVIDELGKFDLIIMGDVIEHFEKDKAYELIDRLFNHSDNILLSTPLGFIEQGAWAGNEQEIHKSGWVLDDFKDYSIIESKIFKDELFSEILKKIPDIPQEKDLDIQLLVLWLKR